MIILLKSHLKSKVHGKRLACKKGKLSKSQEEVYLAIETNGITPILKKKGYLLQVELFMGKVVSRFDFKNNLRLVCFQS